jgi:hypothetical protein
MPAHIVRRDGTRSPARGLEPRPTVEPAEPERPGVVWDHGEAELEIVDELTAIAPGASLPRLAHTLRREPVLDAAEPVPFARSAVSDSFDDRDDISTIAMPRLERPPGAFHAIPLASETERTRQLRNELAEPRPTPARVDVRPARVDVVPTRVDVRPARVDVHPARVDVLRAALPAIVRPPAGLDGPPRRPLAPRTRRAHLVLPIALLLVVLGAGWLWLTLWPR